MLIDTDRGPELASAAARRPPPGPADPARVAAAAQRMVRRALINEMLEANRPPKSAVDAAIAARAARTTFESSVIVGPCSSAT